MYGTTATPSCRGWQWRAVVPVRRSASPRQTRCLGGRVLLIELRLQRGFNLGDFLGAKFVLDPADNDFFGEISKGDQIVWAFKTNTAVRRTGVRTVVSRNCVVTDEDETVRGFPLQICHAPSEYGSHQISPFLSYNSTPGVLAHPEDDRPTCIGR